MKEIELLKIIFKSSPDILEPLNEIDKEIERLHSIIKEARELVKNECWGDNNLKCIDDLIYYKCDELLEILDKVEENK